MLYAPQMAPHHNPEIQAIFDEAVTNAKADMAMFMLLDKMPLEEAEKYTSLSLEEINENMRRYGQEPEHPAYNPIVQEMLDITAEYSIKDIAKTMLTDGIPEDKVVRYSSLPVEEVRKLKNA